MSEFGKHIIQFFKNAVRTDVDDDTNQLPVDVQSTVGLTDAELRAANVGVAVNSTVGLTNEQLRAASVPTDTNILSGGDSGTSTTIDDDQFPMPTIVKYKVGGESGTITDVDDDQSPLPTVPRISVGGSGGTLTEIDDDQVPMPAEIRFDVAGTTTVVSDSDKLPVIGPLTDTELRDANVEVDVVATVGLTDTELRAVAVPVSGPLTNTELRATDVDVLNVDPTDPTRKGEFDQIHKTPVVIEVVHHEAHEGKRFFVHEGIVLNASSKEYLITTPNTTTWAHMTLVIKGSLDFSIRFFEGTGKTGGVAMDEIDHNRNTANASTTIVTHTPTGTEGAGTVILTGLFGTPTLGGGRGGEGGEGQRDEIILKQNEKYSLLVTALSANDNNITVDIDWYEHVSE